MTRSWHVGHLMRALHYISIVGRFKFGSALELERLSKWVVEAMCEGPKAGMPIFKLSDCGVLACFLM